MARQRVLAPLSIADHADPVAEKAITGSVLRAFFLGAS